MMPKMKPALAMKNKGGRAVVEERMKKISQRDETSRERKLERLCG